MNQDAFIIKKNLCNEQVWMFAVLDGHGTHGHFVSGFAKHELVDQIEHVVKNYKAGGKIVYKKSNNSKRELSSSTTSNPNEPDIILLNPLKQYSRNKIRVMNSIEVSDRTMLLENEVDEFVNEPKSGIKNIFHEGKSKIIEISEILKIAFQNTHQKLLE